MIARHLMSVMQSRALEYPVVMLAGVYPRIHADHLDPAVMLGDYFATYFERDLRELIQLRSIRQFENFVRLAAGRVGQRLNLNSLALMQGFRV